VRGGGADIWDPSDQFHYAYQQVTGDVDIVSRVASVEAADTWTKAGAMMRQTLAADAAHAFVVVTPGGEISFQRRPSTGAASQFTLAASATAPYWVRLQRRGGTITAASSPNGSTWTTVGSVTLATGPIYVGLAVTAHNATAAATAQFDNVAVTPVSGTNQPPTVSLTAPANGATFTAPATVTVSASASDTDGTIAAVDFFAGTTLIGSDASSPYSVTWNNVPAGTYSLTAVARDDDGGSTTSAARSITVTSSLPRPTRAVFVASSNHSTAVDRYILNLYPSGAHPDTATPVGPGGSARGAPSAPFTR
jgi:regulation of enolase protein 1 (concanavalin A-like superfamily)